MTGRERMLTTLSFREPDRIPHFEEMFELTPEAFGREFPSEEAIAAAFGEARTRLLHECVELYAAIIERFHWDAVCIWRPWGGPQQRECLSLLQAALGESVLVGGYYRQFDPRHRHHYRLRGLRDRPLRTARGVACAGTGHV